MLDSTLGRLIHILVFVFVSYAACSLILILTGKDWLLLLAAFGPFGIVNAIYYIFGDQIRKLIGRP